MIIKKVEFDMGKLATEELKKLLDCIKKDERVIVPPLPGYDSGVHLMGDKYLVVSTDPCIGVPEEWLGWLLIHYASSDVALFGAKPEFCSINLLGPQPTEPKKLLKIMEQSCHAADDLDMAIVTGHTGVYDGLSTIVGVCTAYGTVSPEKLITPGNAKSGDLLLCTKPIGLETAVNFSLFHNASAKRLFGTEQTEKLAKLVPLQSCVKEALQLAELPGVHALHDATEGGFIAALNEVAEASGIGFTVEFEKVPISVEARKLQERYKLSDEQVLAMSSTGTILGAVEARAKEAIERTLTRNGFSASFPGVFTRSKERVMLKSKIELPFPRIADDPYARILRSKV